MLLRKLEAYGFKSFADKLEIEFGQGITAIVGPNGSGKSNITDAIRWVLGEQNIRNLRGAKTEDIIFSGSTKRRALGIAEVALTFDNSTRLLPLDFHEVTITRRLFRSGDSEYFINKTQCRLKDIHHLLADTGLGREAMTVISQNKIDEVLNSKPEERRLIFEEAAGITRYKSRKRDALRKLEDTEQNLLRIADITTELEGQLLPMAQSAERTRRYLVIERELTACHATVLLNRLQRYQQLAQAAAAEQAELAERQLDYITGLSVQEAEREQRAAELAASEEAWQQASGKINALRTSLERNTAQAGILDERIKQARQAKIKIEEHVARGSQELDEQRCKTSQLAVTLDDKRGRLARFECELNTAIHTEQDLLAHIQSMEVQVEALQNAAVSDSQNLNAQQNRMRTLEYALQSEQERHLMLQEQHSRLLQQKQTAEAADQDFNIGVQQVRSDLSMVQQAEHALQAQLLKQQQLLTAAASQCSQVLQQQNSVQSRLHILTGMQAEYEGLGKGVKSILHCSEGWSSGICGVVAEIIDVPDKHHLIAVETALGATVQHIITQNAHTAKQAIAFLKRRNFGRATFLPLDNIRAAQPRSSELSAAAAQGALGFAAQLVQVDGVYQNIVAFLLGRTVVAVDIDAAQQIARTHNFAVRIVTLEGELMNIGGSMSGGSSARREVSFLSRAGEIEGLRNQLLAITKQAASCDCEQRQLQQTLDCINQRLGEAVASRQTLEVRQAELSAHSHAARRALDDLCQNIQMLTGDQAACQQQCDRLTEQLGSAKLQIDGLVDLDASQKKQAVRCKEQLRAAMAQHAVHSGIVTDQKIEAEGLRQQVRLLEQTVVEQQTRQEKLLVRLEELQVEQQAIDDQMALAAAELAQLSTEQEDLAAQQRLYSAERDRHYQNKLTLLIAIQALEKTLKEVRRKHQEVQNRLHQAALLQTKYSYEADKCRETIEQQYRLSLAAAAAIKREDSEQTLLTRIAALEQEAALIGPVNPNAVEEYERVSERQRFLAQQYNDLVNAKTSLAAIIKDMDNTMVKQFSKAFAKINDFFADIFTRLFGGGQAALTLNSPSNLLESGVDIIVGPPGKKLQNLSLLSGGERALTVIALLFAFLAYRPAPFSVVDEIDAPLDEANLERFGSFLKDYAQHTQFIVVTHRKGTMECADVLHGITIEEAGVSKIVSVKLEDKLPQTIEALIE